MSERDRVVGVPKEIKDNENRVAVQPDGVAELVHHGHQVARAGRRRVGSRFPDDEYAAAGATIVPTADEVFAAADLIVKVKEPIPAEYHRFRPGPAAVHLPAPGGRPPADRVPARPARSTRSRTRPCRPPDRRLPLLTPMSEVAGRMAVQAAAHHLESPAGGAGILLGGVPGTPAAKVTIIGGGVVRHRGRQDRPRHAGHRPGLRHQPGPAGLPVRHLRRPAGPGHPEPGPDGRLRRRLRRGDRRRAGARREGAEAGHPGDDRQHAARAASSSTSPSTRAAASRPAGRPRTPTRPTSRRASCTTASPTSPARSPAPRPSR